MNIYKITNEFGREFYIVASNIDNAIKRYNELLKQIDDENSVIREIKNIGFCVIGE